MHVASYLMHREHAPPGFWPWRDDVRCIEGVEFESTGPTRFFQTVDTHPRSWGRLNWRVQLNKLADDRAALPLFRTFYPGVEWKLAPSADQRWFVTAWFRWDRPAGEHVEGCAGSVAAIESGVISFRIPAFDRDSGETLQLRSRVDARDRRSIADSVQSVRKSDASTKSTLINLDDVLDLH